MRILKALREANRFDINCYKGKSRIWGKIVKKVKREIAEWYKKNEKK